MTRSNRRTVAPFHQRMIDRMRMANLTDNTQTPVSSRLAGRPNTLASLLSMNTKGDFSFRRKIEGL